MRIQLQSFLSVLTGACLLILLSGCQKNLAGRTQVLLVPESQAIAASAQAYTQTIEPLAKAGKINANQQMTTRVTRITNQLIQQAKLKRPDTSNWDWQVKVIEDDQTINAWCMAGGKMAIYTGLIKQLNATDAEIAQVMGHEISHALLNHAAERMSLAMANNLALSVIQQAADVGDGNMALASAAAKIALTLPNSRKGESDADKIGMELAARAGFHPSAAVSLWQKMAAKNQSKSLEFLSTHPSPENRQEKLKKLIPKMLPLYQAANN